MNNLKKGNFSMNKRRKISFIILLSMIISALSFVNVAALKIGDEIGNVLNTDIKTYVNGQRIPSYNINDKSAVLIKDLTNYGFDSSYDDKTRTATLTYNPDKQMTPITQFDENNNRPGTVAFKYVYTDIVAYVNGKQVESFNIKGNLAIFFGDLKDYGTFFWDGAARESRFTATKQAAEVLLSQTSAAIKAGEAIVLTATVQPYDAVNRNVTWTSSNTNVAQVNNNGYVTGISVGSATITAATTNGKTAKCVVTVTTPAVAAAGISLNRTSAAINKGETLILTATVLPSNAADKSVTWTSSNTNIAWVYDDGYVVAVSAGTATITAATANGKTARCTVTVNPQSVPVTGLTLNKTSVTLDMGSADQLTATVYPANAANKNVKWSSTNAGIVTVNSNGVLTPVAPGMAVITVITEDGGYSAACVVTVNPMVTSISLNKTSLSMAAGQSEQLILTINPSTATNVAAVAWSSKNPSIADVDKTGKITAKSIGTAVITVTVATSQGGAFIANCVVTVTPIPG
ncbi:MAG: Ig-like domain-containing protein [Oscillospiraceae bacterium]|nr:Ig-like domain-containing protein [Oscillospiraceae bacterium]